MATVTKKNGKTIIQTPYTKRNGKTVILVEVCDDIKIKKEKPKVEWVNEFEIGEEVLVHIEGKYIKSVVKKINKTSVSVNLYDYNIIYCYDGCNRLIWLDITNEVKTKFSREGIIKKGQEEYNRDNSFIEGSYRTDYNF